MGTSRVQSMATLFKLESIWDGVVLETTGFVSGIISTTLLIHLRWSTMLGKQLKMSTSSNTRIQAAQMLVSILDNKLDTKFLEVSILTVLRTIGFLKDRALMSTFKKISNA